MEEPLPEDLSAARTFCELVQTRDLFAWLGVEASAPAEEALEALARQRRRMQAMQHNPKYADAARQLMRNYQRFVRVLGDPEAHLAGRQRDREDEKVPMLQLALESVMADGVISAQEEAFLRRTSLELGISEGRYEQELRARVSERGVVLELTDPLSPRSVSPEAQRARRFRGADGHGWWDAGFTRRLLECIPGGPGDLVDVYCRTGLSASTLLPQRPQLAWTGIDRDPDRVAQARALLADQAPHALSRIALLPGTPDQLPLADASMDYALLVRALPGLDDTRSALAEVARVLRPGGRAIAVEADGLAEQFYFRGPLRAYNQAFQALCLAVDSALGNVLDPLGRPGIALGPTVPARLEHAGFRATTVQVHASHNLRMRTFGRLAPNLRRYPLALADRAGLGGSPLLARVLQEVDTLEHAHSPEERGIGGHVLPLFVCVGDLPSVTA